MKKPAWKIREEYLNEAENLFREKYEKDKNEKD
jgi:hypothetical protein